MRKGLFALLLLVLSAFGSQHATAFVCIAKDQVIASHTPPNARARKVVGDQAKVLLAYLQDQFPDNDFGSNPTFVLIEGETYPLVFIVTFDERNCANQEVSGLRRDAVLEALDGNPA